MREIVGNDGLIGMEDISGNMITSGKRYEVRNKQPDEWRRQVLPVPATVVPANGVAQVQVQPQRLFKGKRLSLTQTDGAGAFVTGCRIADLKIGQNSQFVAAGNQPVECYKPEAVSSYVDLDDADIGNLVTLQFQNPTATDITIEGVLFGIIAQ